MIPNYNNDREQIIISKKSEKSSFQYFKRHQTLFSNLLNKFTGKHLDQVDGQVIYPTKKKKEIKLHTNANKNDRFSRICFVDDSKSMNSIKKVIPKNYKTKMTRKIVKSTNINSNTNKSRSPQNLLLNVSSLSENVGCLNKLNWKKSKRENFSRINNSCKPNEFSDRSDIHVKNILNIGNLMDSYVLSDDHSECLNNFKSSKRKNNSRESLENSENEQKNNFCSKSDSNSFCNYNSIGKRNTTRKTDKKENEGGKYSFPDSTVNELSSYLQANLIVDSKSKIIKKQKTSIRNKLKIKQTLKERKLKSIQIKSDKIIKTKHLKRIGSKLNKNNQKFHKIKQKKFTNNLLKVRQFEFKYSYRTLFHEKPYYIIDDLINYSFYLHYTLTVFDKLRIESANVNINDGFDFLSIYNCQSNSQSIEISIQIISPFQVDIFHVYHNRSISKFEKLKIFINKMDYEFVESITEFRNSNLNQRVNIQQHRIDTYYILSKTNFHKREIIDRNAVCWNDPLEDSWDEISPTKSNTSCTIATKDKSISSDVLHKTEDIYGSDIEMDFIPEIFSDDDLEDKSSIDRVRSEEYYQVNNHQTSIGKINSKWIIDENQLIEFSRSVETFEVKYGNLLIFSKILKENYTSLNSCAIMEKPIYVFLPIVYVFPVKENETISTFIIESCEKLDSDEIIPQCCIKVEEISLKLLILPVVNYINIDKEQFSNVLSTTNESSIRCWEIINEGDNNENFIDSQKIVNQLKLLMISEISISIDKSIYNFQNIIINSHEELFKDSSNNTNYRCYY